MPDQPPYRRGQCYTPKINLAARKELANLASANPTNVRISWIIDKKIVPERKAARLISQAVDRGALALRGFEFSWASGRCRDGMMTAALVLAPGPYQVLINVPWNGEDSESIVCQLSLILGQPPEVWPNVEWNPQVRGLGPPPITGPGWNRNR